MIILVKILQFINRLNSTGYPQNKLHYIVGDVMETLQDKSKLPEKIAILRLDTDWYESSKYELEQMYDNVVIGGVIIFDDYYHWDGQRRSTDDFLQAGILVIQWLILAIVKLLLLLNV